MNEQLNALVLSVIADGKVDAAEVSALREMIMKDGQVDREEAEALFKINDAVSGGENCPEWKQFFVEAVGSHLLNDATSPNVVDGEEAQWLLAKVSNDGKVDELEKALLTHIKANATTMDIELATKISELGL